MRFKLYIPEKKQLAFHSCWEMILDSDQEPVPQIVPPFGCPELIFYPTQESCIHEANVKSCLIKGQYTLPQKINLAKGAHLFGIRLHPFGLHQYFEFDTSKLLNAILDGADFGLTKTIQQVLKNSSNSMQANVQRIYETLTAGMIKNPTPAVVRFLEEAEHETHEKTSELIDRSGLSERQFQRVFTRETGLNPKTYMRIARVNRMEEILKSSEDWFEVISQLQLTDQSHLAKEIKKFRHVTPTELVSKNLLLSKQLPQPEIQHLILK